MSILNCFTAKIAAGAVKAEAGNPVAAEIARLETKLAEAGADAEAIRAAYADFLSSRGEAAARDKVNAYRSIEAQINYQKRKAAAFELLDALRGEHRAPVALAGGKYRESPLIAVARSMLATDVHELARGPNVHAMRAEVLNEAMRLFADAIEALRAKNLGLKPETSLELDVGRALFGQPTEGVASRQFAESWLAAAEYLRTEYNAAGGNIPMLDKWRLPQSHDATKVASVRREDWKAFVRPLLDREQMLKKDAATGRRLDRALDDAELETVLDKVYDAIIARGSDDAPSAAFTGAGALANRRAEARVLAFKDFDAWLSYKQAFGMNGGMYDDMVSHIQDMAGDIGLMRVMGPNPEATFRYIDSDFEQEIKRLQKEAPAGASAEEVRRVYRDNQALIGEIRADQRKFQNLWAETTGANRVPVAPGLAATMSEMRAFLVGSQLGSAVISSITDTGSMAVVARMNDLPVGKMLGDLVSDLFDPKADIKAAQLGLISQDYARGVRETVSIMGEEIRVGLFGRISSLVLKVSGQQRWTRLSRNNMAKQFMAVGATNLGRDFADISEGFRAGLERNGITAEDWARLAKVAPTEPVPGARFLTVADVRAVDEGLASKWSQYITTEVDFAVYDGNPLTNAIMTGQSRPGTVGGEMRRAVKQYKGFGVNLITMHGNRALARGWDGSRLGLYAQGFIMMTLLGAVAMQTKQIANGKDPLTLDPSTDIGRRAWLAAMIQGGGLGLFGDLMFQDKTRFGNTWATLALGPQGGLVEDVLGRWVMANTTRALKGEETHFGGDALYVLGRYLPGSSLWFGRLAFQRAVMDQLALMIDERAPQRFARMEAEAAKNFGQSFWFAPGQSAPSRAPDLSAIGGAP